MFSPQIYREIFVNHRYTGGFTYFALHIVHATFCIEPRKLKALTGYAPADYIRLIRLQHAAQLLKQGEYTITEIADKVGFSDAKYFREVFKKYYGVSPSKYVEAEKIHSQSSEQD